MKVSSASAAAAVAAGQSTRVGLAQALGAFMVWGLLPLYFRALDSVAPLGMIVHRSVWSLVFVLGTLALLGRWDWLRTLRGPPRELWRYAGAAALLAGNWWVYVWAVQQQQVVQASLGYFINPLVNVLLGVTVLHERLRRAQWLAVALAALGVAWLTWHTGSVPWVSLVLALSFGIYGLIRKTSKLGPLEGLALETLLLAPIMVPAMLWWTFSQGGALTRGEWPLTLALLAAGPLSAIPLVLFAAGARRLPLALVGLVQYVSPSIQLLVGVWLFHEPFGHTRLVGFLLIWAALLLLSVDALKRASVLRIRMPRA